MPMHEMMDHQEHQADHQSSKVPDFNTTAGFSGRHCRHCAYPQEPGSSFCPNCGMSLRTATCPACGQKVDPDWTTCAYCGSPLREAQVQQA